MSQPEGDGGSEGDGGEEVPRELIIAGSDTAEVLEAAEHSLDAPSVLVAALVVLDGALAVTATGDNRDGALLAQLGAKAIGVVTSVGDDALHAHGCVDEKVDALDIGSVSRRQREAERPPEEVDECMDLRRPTTARDANGLGSSPPFAPPEHRCALT